MDISNLNYDDDNEVIQNDDNNIQVEEPVVNEKIEENEEEDILETFLKTQGISDMHKIMFEDEDGTEIERDWNELSKSELLNILRSGEISASETELDDEEIELINRIRTSKMTPTQYIQSLSPQVIQEEPHYTVDELSDDELYMLDLQARIPDITDEQLQNMLNKAKEDEDLFGKQITGIRNEYKQLEDARNSEQAALQEEQMNQQYQQFANSIQQSIMGLNQIGELDISMDNDDMDRLASFILDRDETGTSYFARALNNPDELVRMAWFALNGEEIINSISDYYKREISQLTKNNKQKSAPVVTKRSSSNKPTAIKSVDNLLYN